MYSKCILYAQLMAAQNARAANASASVEAAALMIVMDWPFPDYISQTDSGTTETYSDGGHRMPAPAYSRSWTHIVYTAREVEENTLRTRESRLRQGLSGEGLIIYTAAELKENESRTRCERHRKRLMGRRSSRLTPFQLRLWIRSIRSRPDAWRRRKHLSISFARDAKLLVTENDSFQYGVQRIYIPDL
jgi:hypothetical protein